MHVRDGYGQDLDRTGVCYDSSQSVVVMITDVCKCLGPDPTWNFRSSTISAPWLHLVSLVCTVVPHLWPR
jgi:hypothetical protein